MPLTSFLAAHAALLAAFAAAAYGFGAALTVRTRFESSAEAVAARTTLGLGVLSNAVFAAGLLGLLKGPVGVALLVAGVALALASARRARRGARMGPRGALFFVLALALLAAPLEFALYPPAEWDDISYHLASAKQYVEAGRITVVTYLRYPVFPQAQDMLFALALLLGDDVLAQLVSFLGFLLIGAWLFGWWCRERPRAALWAAALWLGSPTAIHLGGIAYVDVAVTLFATAALVCAHSAGGGRGRLALAGAFAGLAAATKYSGLFFAVAAPLLAAAGAPRGRRGRSALLVAAAGVMVALPWYARSAWIAGDPFFPALQPWLGNPWWSDADWAFQMNDLRSFGIGRSALSFVRVWWDLAFQQGTFTGPEDLSSLAWLMPMPLLVVLTWRDAAARSLALLCVAFTACWFLGSQGTRYLLPILPVLCALVARLFDRASAAWLERWGGERDSIEWRSAAIALLFLLPGTLFALDRIGVRGPIPADREARHRYLAARLPSYPFYAEMNRRYGRDYGVYALYDGRMAYYADGRFAGDWFGPARFARIEPLLDDPDALERELRALGTQHLVVDLTDPRGRRPDPERLARRFEVAGRSDEAMWFRMREKASGDSAGPPAVP